MCFHSVLLAHALLLYTPILVFRFANAIFILLWTLWDIISYLFIISGAYCCFEAFQVYFNFYQLVTLTISRYMFFMYLYILFFFCIRSDTSSFACSTSLTPLYMFKYFSKFCVPCPLFVSERAIKSSLCLSISCRMSSIFVLIPVVLAANQCSFSVFISRISYKGFSVSIFFGNDLLAHYPTLWSIWLRGLVFITFYNTDADIICICIYLILHVTDNFYYTFRLLSILIHLHFYKTIGIAFKLMDKRYTGVPLRVFIRWYLRNYNSYSYSVGEKFHK